MTFGQLFVWEKLPVIEILLTRSGMMPALKTLSVSAALAVPTG
jgi:hypothetical protein